MSSLVTSVFTFKIESNFNEWAAIFDSSEADKRHSKFNIKSLFRGISKESPQMLLSFIKLQRAIFKNLLKLMGTGCRLTELTYPLWKNPLGLLN